MKDIVIDIDMWGNKKETQLQEKISALTSKLIRLEQEMYVESQLLRDKDFARKSRFTTEYHTIYLKKLRQERKEVLKLIRGYERELAKLKVEKEMEEIKG